MTVKIEKSKAFGRITAPPSKSMAHRYLICGAFSKGSEIDKITFSEDIKATLYCLECLGAVINIQNNKVKIGGLDINKKVKKATLFCGESGSTLRFLLPICLLFNQKIKLRGSERLFARSLSVYEELCKSLGFDFMQDKDSVIVKGKLLSGKYSVRGDISSQFISGLMFALAQLEGDSEINITGKIESDSYLNLTIKAFADFGVRISRIDERTIYIKGGQKCKGKKLTVEGDYSNSAFLEALNVFGGNVIIKGLDSNSAQGDKIYSKVFADLVKGKPTVDISDSPDLAPVLMAVAAAENGAVFTGTKRLKIKESDRGEAMKTELFKFGCNVVVEENKITVNKGKLHKAESPILSHNDHRIVMATAILGTLTGCEILGAEAINKSFPDFFEKLISLGIKVSYL